MHLYPRSIIAVTSDALSLASIVVGAVALLLEDAATALRKHVL